MNLAFFTRLPRIGSLAALGLIGAAMASPRLAGAGTVAFEIPTVTITHAEAVAGYTGYLNVGVSETGGGDTLYQVGLDVYLNPGTSGVNFVPYAGDGSVTGQTAGSDYNTQLGSPALTYLFNVNSVGSSNIVNQSPVFVDSFDPSGTPTNESEAQQSDLTNSSGVALSSTLYGLMRIEYNIPAGTAAGTYPITFNNQVEGGSGTFYDNVSTLDLNYLLPGSLTNGVLVVQNSPEPSSIVMMILGAVGLLGLGWRRARRA